MAGIDTEQRLALRNKNFLAQEKESFQKKSEKFSIELRKNKRMEGWNKSRRKELYNAKNAGNILEILERILYLKPGESNDALLNSLKESFKETEKNLVNEDHLKVLVSAFKWESEANQTRILDFLINFTCFCDNLNEYLVKIGVFWAVSEFFAMVDKEMCKNAVWLVSNLVNGNSHLKSKMVCMGFLDSLLEMLKIQRLPKDTIEIVLWTFSQFNQFVLRLSGERLKELVSILTTYAIHSKIQYSYYSIHTLFNILSHNESYLPQLLSSNILEILIQDLSTSPCKVQYIRLKLFGAILSSKSDEYTENLISLSILPQLYLCLSHSKVKIRFESFFCFSNIAAGTVSQKSVLINKQLLFVCISSLKDVISISQEAFHVLFNLSLNLSPAKCEQILTDGVLHYLIETLSQTLNMYPHTKKLLTLIERILLKLSEESLQNLLNSGFFNQLSELEFAKNCEFSLELKRFLDNLIN